MVHGGQEIDQVALEGLSVGRCRECVQSLKGEPGWTVSDAACHVSGGLKVPAASGLYLFRSGGGGFLEFETAPRLDA